MSTLKTTNIQNASSSSTNLALDTSGNATSAGTVVMSSPYTMRNKIINGAMQFWQRGTSISSGTGALTYTTDRFFVFATGAAVTAAQVTGPSGYQYALQVTGAASNTYVGIYQRIESVNCYDLVGQSVTIQANIKVSTNQTVSWSLVAANSADNYSAQTTLSSGTWSATTTATVFTATISSLASVAANGMQLIISPNNGGVFTSGTIQITGVQLERGTVATPFEYRNYQQELAMCQRYYEKSFSINTAPADGVGQSTTDGCSMGLFNAYGTSDGFFTPVTFQVAKRASPTITFYRGGGGATNGVWATYDSGWTSVTTMTLTSANTSGYMVTGTRSGAFTTKAAYLGTGNWVASAEL